MTVFGIATPASGIGLLLASGTVKAFSAGSIRARSCAYAV